LQQTTAYPLDLFYEVTCRY